VGVAIDHPGGNGEMAVRGQVGADRVDEQVLGEPFHQDQSPPSD
jgi:hypothetical protein